MKQDMLHEINNRQNNENKKYNNTNGRTYKSHFFLFLQETHVYKFSSHSPRSMIPASGSRRNPPEKAFFPANSFRFHTGMRRKGLGTHPEDGSSIPSGKLLYRKRVFSFNFPLPEHYRNYAVSYRKLHGTQTEPAGKLRELNHQPGFL